MIVRDEAHVIERCLRSVRPIISSWCIVDTGSSDDTPEIVRRELADLPGRLHFRPWRGFGENRTEAIDLARGLGDFLLFIDADDLLDVPADYRLPELLHDAYELTVEHGTLRHRRLHLVRAALPWVYRGVLHEYLDCELPFSRALLSGPTVRIVGGGARSQQAQHLKYGRDAEALERTLLTEPDNSRYVFYLAQSYRDAGEPEKALQTYLRRSTMAGFDQEVYVSLLNVARLRERLAHPADQVLASYLAAYESRPSRCEALGELARFLRESGRRWPLAYLFARAAAAIPPSDDALFVEPCWQQWRNRDELAIAAYWIGRYEESRDACEALLASPDLPETQRARVQANLRFALDRLGTAPRSSDPSAQTNADAS